MTILGRYITKTIILSTLFSILVMSGVLVILSLVGELKDLGQGDYSLNQAVFYVVLRLPLMLYQFSPLLILLGCIIGLSILSHHRELAVMRASGFSIRQIIYSTLVAALVMVLFIGWIGEWFAPNLSYQAEINKDNSQNAGQAVVTASGVWLHVGNNFVHVQHVIGRNLLEGVTHYQFDNKHHLQAASYAKTVLFQNNHWVMYDMVKTAFYDDRTQSTAYPQGDWDLVFNPNLLNVGLVDPSEMSLPKLFKFAHYLEHNGLRAIEYRYQFWQRVFQPFAAIVMIFLAIPFVLGIFNTKSVGLRIMAGMMVGFTFFISNAFLGQLCVVFQLPTVVAASFPLFVFGALGLVLSRRLNRH